MKPSRGSIRLDGEDRLAIVRAQFQGVANARGHVGHEADPAWSVARREVGCGAPHGVLVLDARVIEPAGNTEAVPSPRPWVHVQQPRLEVAAVDDELDLSHSAQLKPRDKARCNTDQTGQLDRLDEAAAQPVVDRVLTGPAGSHRTQKAPLVREAGHRNLRLRRDHLLDRDLVGRDHSCRCPVAIQELDPVARLKRLATYRVLQVDRRGRLDDHRVVELEPHKLRFAVRIPGARVQDFGGVGGRMEAPLVDGPHQGLPRLGDQPVRSRQPAPAPGHELDRLVLRRPKDPAAHRLPVGQLQ